MFSPHEPIPPELEDELEVKFDLINRQDYAGLVAYVEGIVARRPDDHCTLKDLGEAHAMNSEPERGLEVLESLYRRVPHLAGLQWVILDVLFALGLDEGDFEWVEKPVVVRLDAGTLNACVEILDRDREVGDIEGLYYRLLGRGYCAFSEEELLGGLRADGRFVVRGEDALASVRVRDGGGR